MKNLKSVFLSAVALAALSTNSFADTINPLVAGSTFVNLASATNGTGAFFDNQSDDGATCNIGYILMGTANVACETSNLPNSGNFGGITPTGANQYSYLNSQGGFTISPTLSQGTSTTLQIEIAGQALNNRIGYRLTSGGPVTWLTPSTGTPNPVAGFINVLAGQTFEFVAEYKSVDADPAGQFAYSGGTDRGRFAIFALNSATNFSGGMTAANTSRYVVGFEDGPAGRLGFGDRDFQDIVLVATVVPEPATVTALGFAVVATVVAVRRRRQKA